MVIIFNDKDSGEKDDEMWKSQKNVCYLRHLVGLGNKINRIFY